MRELYQKPPPSHLFYKMGKIDFYYHITICDLSEEDVLKIHYAC